MKSKDLLRKRSFRLKSVTRSQTSWIESEVEWDLSKLNKFRVEVERTKPLESVVLGSDSSSVDRVDRSSKQTTRLESVGRFWKSNSLLSRSSIHRWKWSFKEMNSFQRFRASRISSNFSEFRLLKKSARNSANVCRKLENDTKTRRRRSSKLFCSFRRRNFVFVRFSAVKRSRSIGTFLWCFRRWQSWNTMGKFAQWKCSPRTKQRVELTRSNRKTSRFC